MATRRSYLQKQIIWMALLDAFCLVGGIMGGVVARLGFASLEEYVILNTSGWLDFAATIIVANYVAGSYGLELRLSRFNMVVNWLFSIAMALLMVGATSYAWLDMALGRGVLLLAIVFYSVAWLTVRLIIYYYFFQKEAFGYRVVILGSGSRARSYRELVENEDLRPAHKVVAMLQVEQAGSGRQAVRGEKAGKAVIECGAAHVESVIKSMGADVVIIGVDREEELAGVYPQLRRLRFEGVSVLTPLDVAETYHGKAPLNLVDEHWLMHASQGFVTPVAMRFKRLMDALIIVALGLPAALVALLIAMLIKVSAPRRPVFYVQERVGRFGVIFRIYKFRTMNPDAEKATGAVWSPENDSRITRLGRFLRKFRLDELPQLINVLKGDMSLVGPRPERPELVEKLAREIPFYRERENIPPGLTGWAQIRYPYGASIEDSRAKLEYDLYYLQNLSVALDLRIILRTLRIVLFGLERDMR
jgi:exopolysaccharide biosynthesis polyprenyl glycosylphosphotransferase